MLSGSLPGKSPVFSNRPSNRHSDVSTLKVRFDPHNASVRLDASFKSRPSLLRYITTTIDATISVLFDAYCKANSSAAYLQFC